MRKIFSFKVISLLLTALLILPAASCAGTNTADTTSPETAAAFASPTPTPLPTPTPAPTAPTVPDLGPVVISDVDWVNDPILPVTRKDPNIENILLMGIDGGDEGVSIGHRSDCMVILSINTKDNTIKLSSIMRDIKAYFPSKDKNDKLNAAYQYGGPGQVINVINHNFDLDIQKYLVLDFENFRNTVNTLGGVSVDMNEKEATAVMGIPAAGTYHMDGLQALAYCRIRKIDSEFNRVARQRKFLITIFNTLRTQDLTTQFTTCHNILSLMRTNMTAEELTGHLFEFALAADRNVTEYSVPAEGMYTQSDSGTFYFNLNWEEQVPALQEFIYAESAVG